MTDVKQARAWLWLVVPMGVALLASGVYVGRTWVRPTAQVTSHAERAKNEDEERIASLEQEMRRLRGMVAMQAARAAAREENSEERVLGGTQEPPSEGEAENGAEERIAEPVEDERAMRAAQLDFWDGLAEQVRMEPRDARFSGETEPLITRLLSQHLGSQVNVSEVACASSICRAKVVHSDSPRLSEARLADFMLQRESLASMSVQLDLREDGVTTLYFIRSDG